MPANNPSLDDEIAIPPRDSFNIGLSSAREDTMMHVFGKPGALTSDCSDPTGSFSNRIVSNADVGPFRVRGLDEAVESLRQIFIEVRTQLPEVYQNVKQDGMLCVRHRRQNPSRYSNHSWGTAIDIFFGRDVVPQGRPRAHRGNALLAPFFNRHGWYWGAGFSGDSVDSMHFELADETILRLARLRDGAGAGTGANPASLLAAATGSGGGGSSSAAAPRFTTRGKMSTFGGPRDTGVGPDEDLALVNTHAAFVQLQQYFLNQQPPGTTGYARRLNPDSYYLACRWDYDVTPPSTLRAGLATVTNPANGRSAQAKPMDWGPNRNTGRVADLSPGLASYLGLNTDEIVEVVFA